MPVEDNIWCRITNKMYGRNISEIIFYFCMVIKRGATIKEIEKKALKHMASNLDTPQLRRIMKYLEKQDILKTKYGKSGVKYKRNGFMRKITNQEHHIILEMSMKLLTKQGWKRNCKSKKGVTVEKLVDQAEINMARYLCTNQQLINDPNITLMMVDLDIIGNKINGNFRTKVNKLKDMVPSAAKTELEGVLITIEKIKNILLEIKLK